MRYDTKTSHFDKRKDHLKDKGSKEDRTNVFLKGGMETLGVLTSATKKIAMMDSPIASGENYTP